MFEERERARAERALGRAYVTHTGPTPHLVSLQPVIAAISGPAVVSVGKDVLRP